MDAKTASVFLFSPVLLVAFRLRNFDYRNNVALRDAKIDIFVLFCKTFLCFSVIASLRSPSLRSGRCLSDSEEICRVGTWGSLFSPAVACMVVAKEQERLFCRSCSSIHSHRTSRHKLQESARKLFHCFSVCFVVFVTLCDKKIVSAYSLWQIFYYV